MNPHSPAFLAEDRSRHLVNVIVTFTILETFFICLFFTSRIMARTANGWDVFLMIPGYLCAFTNAIIGARKSLAYLKKRRTEGRLDDLEFVAGKRMLINLQSRFGTVALGVM